MASYQTYFLARGALSGVLLVASFVMWIVSLVKAKTRKDPARTAFIWQRISFGFFILFCILDAAMYLFLPFVRNYGYLSTNLITSNLGTLGTLWYNVTDILIFMALVRLNNGILIAQAKQTNSLPKILKNISWGAFAILIILAGVVYATTTAYNIMLTYGSYSNVYRVIQAYYALIFVASVGILGQTIYVFIQARVESHLAQPSIYSLVCAILYFMHQLYEMIVVNTVIEGYYMAILEVIFSLWPMFIILVLLFVLGSRRESPLWTNSAQQPVVYMAAPPGGQPAPAFYTVNGVTYAAQPLPMQQAYMPQQVPQQAYLPQGAPPQGYAPQTYQQPPPPPGQGMYVVPPELSAPNSYGYAGQTQQQTFPGFKAEGPTPSPPSVGGAQPPPPAAAATHH